MGKTCDSNSRITDPFFQNGPTAFTDNLNEAKLAIWRRFEFHSIKFCLSFTRYLPLDNLEHQRKSGPYIFIDNSEGFEGFADESWSELLGIGDGNLSQKG